MFVAGIPALTSGLPVFSSSGPTVAGFGGVGRPVDAGPSVEAGSADAAAAKIAPAVVAITATFAYRQSRGAGTGIVLTSDGEVLTNNHVINGATRIQAVDGGNGRTYSATVIGYDSSHDLALLRLTGASGLRTARIGDSSRLAVGQPVVASGNAGGTGTMTTAPGRITRLDQAITATDEMTGATERLSGLIEVDADIRPGHSGGPLVDIAGRVIGVDTAASVGMRFQGAGGRGYAIPIAQAMQTVRQIESGRGSATVHVGPTAFLGVLLVTGQRDGGSGGDAGGSGGTGTGGAVVSGVVSGGPAARVGVVAGDVITSLDGRTIDAPATLSAVMARLRPGDQVQIGWRGADGTSRSETVRLGVGPPA